MTEQKADDAAKIKRLRAENAWLIERFAEAQVTIRAANGVPYVPAEQLAELIRKSVRRINFDTREQR
jgi:type II secretory pathway component PulM